MAQLYGHPGSEDCGVRCDYAPARAYLEKVTQEELDKIEKNKHVRAENDKAQLESKRRSYEEAVAKHNELLASQEDFAAKGSPVMQALTKDRATFSSLTSCSSITPEAFVSDDVQSKARQVVGECDRPNPRIAPLQILGGYIEYRLKGYERAHLHQVQDLPRQVSNSEANVRMYKEDFERLQASIDSGEWSGEKNDADNQRWLSARLAAFQGVKELSQWVIVDGEPNYLGSRVDVLFEGQPVKVPVEATFVFKQAEDNAARLTPLYEYALKQMFGQFKDSRTR